jgi:hypothetical protein
MSTLPVGDALLVERLGGGGALHACGLGVHGDRCGGGGGGAHVAFLQWAGNELFDGSILIAVRIFDNPESNISEVNSNS